MNTNVFREFAEKLKPWTCPAHGHFIETTAKRTFSPAYDLLEEAREHIDMCSVFFANDVIGLAKDRHELILRRITAFLKRDDFKDAVNKACDALMITPEERDAALLSQKGNDLESDKPLPQGMSLVPMAKAIRELAKKGVNRAVVDLDKYDLILKTNQSLPCADSVISTPQVAEEKCPHCGGDGYTIQDSYVTRYKVAQRMSCPTCKGTGTIPTHQTKDEG